MFARVGRKIESVLRNRKAALLGRLFPGLRPGQIKHLTYISDHLDLEGMRILEIGGDPDALFARALIHLGAASVLSTNISEGYDRLPKYPGIERRVMDVRKLDVEPESFDCVIGIAVLEHIHDLGVALENVFEVVRPGGKIYFHGGPVWSGPKGHHVWIDGPSGRQYRFTNDNPLQDWEHLYSDEQSIATRLTDEGIPADDAQSIVGFVFHSPCVNRASVRDITKYFSDSPFRVIDTATESGALPRGDVADLLGRCSDLSLQEHAISSVMLLAEKPLAEH